MTYLLTHCICFAVDWSSVFFYNPTHPIPLLYAESEALTVVLNCKKIVLTLLFVTSIALPKLAAADSYYVVGWGLMVTSPAEFAGGFYLNNYALKLEEQAAAAAKTPSTTINQPVSAASQPGKAAEVAKNKGFDFLEKKKIDLDGSNKKVLIGTKVKSASTGKVTLARVDEAKNSKQFAKFIEKSSKTAGVKATTIRVSEYSRSTGIMKIVGKGLMITGPAQLVLGIGMLYATPSRSSENIQAVYNKIRNYEGGAELQIAVADKLPVSHR